MDRGREIAAAAGVPIIYANTMSQSGIRRSVEKAIEATDRAIEAAKAPVRTAGSKSG